MGEQRAWWGERAVHEFQFPPRIADEAGCRKVGLVELTWDDEERASKLGAGTVKTYMAMLVRMSIATIDGCQVEQDGLEVQRLYASSSKVRTLLQAARGKVQDPEEEELQGFLGSLTLRVG